VNRGWKQVGDPFHFPSTCTNSAYILKAVYTKYLVIHIYLSIYPFHALTQLLAWLGRRVLLEATLESTTRAISKLSKSSIAYVLGACQ
jgi:hypothetical protein